METASAERGQCQVEGRGWEPSRAASQSAEERGTGEVVDVDTTSANQVTLGNYGRVRWDPCFRVITL